MATNTATKGATKGATTTATKSAPASAGKIDKTADDASPATTPDPTGTRSQTNPTEGEKQARENTEVQAETERAAIETDGGGAGGGGAMQRALEQGIGLVEVRGTGYRYVGVSPAREGGKAIDPQSGHKLTSNNTVFTPLNAVPYERGQNIKDPSSGLFYTAPTADSDAPTQYLSLKHPDSGNPLVADKKGK